MISSLPNKAHYAIPTYTVLSMRTVTTTNIKRAKDCDKYTIKEIFYTEQGKL